MDHVDGSSRPTSCRTPSATTGLPTHPPSGSANSRTPRSRYWPSCTRSPMRRRRSATFRSPPRAPTHCAGTSAGCVLVRLRGARHRPIPAVERAFEWLEENFPDEPRPPSRCWPGRRPHRQRALRGLPTGRGAGLGDGDLGPRELDVAWIIFAHMVFQELAGLAGCPGCPTSCARTTSAPPMKADRRRPGRPAMVLRLLGRDLGLCVHAHRRTSGALRGNREARRRGVAVLPRATAEATYRRRQLMLGPMDEFPVHQTPQPIAWPGSSDRNFYDRSYFNAHDRTGNIFLITGLGYYPNLGVKDAFVLVRRGDVQTAVHLSTPSTRTGSNRTSTGTASRSSSRCTSCGWSSTKPKASPSTSPGRASSTSSRSSPTSCGPAPG